MTREEADAACDRLNREHPDRAIQHWLPREDEEGGWQVGLLRLPLHWRRGPMTAMTEAKPKPQQQDDPRPSEWREVPGY